MTLDEQSARVLLELGLDLPAPAGGEPDATGAESAARIGAYELLEELGHGGMGVVHRAQHATTGALVALKMIRAGRLASADERRRFRTEIKAVAALEHPHIVPIQEVGEHEGRPYYTMPLYTGSLAGQLPRYRAPVAAAKLVAAVARAVAHAHERLVLHRDLKPENILLDEDGQPYVSDFGAAKYLEAVQTEPLSSADPSAVIGTLAYMAPERLREGARAVTTAVDVYSLGVVLYRLITGRLPFQGSRLEVVRAALELEPTHPRVLVPRIPRDLETICLQCLDRDPARRYRSAGELAVDLERFLDARPIAARPGTLAGRAWRFARRYAAALGAIAVLAAIASAAVYVAHAQEGELRRTALDTNAYAAHALAGAVAFHLREEMELAVAIAAEPEAARALRDLDGESLERRRAGTSFTSVGLYDRFGVSRVHASTASNVILGKDYAWRDYFLGARRLGEAGLRTGYISRACLSESADIWVFGIAVPVYDEGEWAGVLLATVATDSALRKQRLDRATGDGPMAVVVAPRDRTRTSTEGAGDYVVILHDGLTHGAGIVMDSPRLRELRVTRAERDQLRSIDPEPITEADHRDPVPGFEGRWLAGFAPVGETGFVVIVQTRYDAAVAPSVRVLRISWAGGAALASTVLGLGLWGGLRRRRRARTGESGR